MKNELSGYSGIFQPMPGRSITTALFPGLDSGVGADGLSVKSKGSNASNFGTPLNQTITIDSFIRNGLNQNIWFSTLFTNFGIVASFSILFI